MKIGTCKDCQTEFEIPSKRGRPPVKCGPCRTKKSTVLQFSKMSGETIELQIEVIDGFTWVESAEPCEICSNIFMRPRRRGRPPKMCPDCAAIDDVEKAVLRTTSQETLDALFSGDKDLLKGTLEALPKGSEAQCVTCWRIFTSDTSAEAHKTYKPSGGVICSDPATLGMVPRERRGLPIWTRPT